MAKLNKVVTRKERWTKLRKKDLRELNTIPAQPQMNKSQLELNPKAEQDLKERKAKLNSRAAVPVPAAVAVPAPATEITSLLDSPSLYRGLSQGQ